MPPKPSRADRRRQDPSTTALFVRIPAEQARKLDRVAFELRRPKQELVSGLLERYVDVDLDSLERLAALTGALDDRRRRVTVETLDGGELPVGHHSFRPREPDVLTLEEAAELLQVEVGVVEQLAEAGELPGRRLGGQWRFARTALLHWLAAPPAALPAAADAPIAEPGSGPASPDR